ncbi:MAG TPA: PH domain-containing protein, partial [Pseudonocardiaceae bacterium]|nr:PH domain-containing protein [Pseudonocardiaceae bacterium]
MVQVRQHWAFLLKPMVQTVGVVIIAFMLSLLVSRVGRDLWLLQSLLWYAAVVAVVYFGWKVLEWWIEVITVTDKRLMRTSGVIQTKNSMIPITKVTDLTFERPFIGQLLGYGTLRVESAGQKPDLKTIEYVPRPEEVFRAISELIFGEKKQARSHMLGPPRPS